MDALTYATVKVAILSKIKELYEFAATFDYGTPEKETVMACINILEGKDAD